MDTYGLTRVAVVDFDVHHGNGTEALLWDDPRTFFGSSHQVPLWPSTGHSDNTGPHSQIMNRALPSGTEMRACYAEAVFHRLRAFDPELILISVGFDAHRDAPGRTQLDNRRLRLAHPLPCRHRQRPLPGPPHLDPRRGATTSTLSPPQPAPMSRP